MGRRRTGTEDAHASQMCRVWRGGAYPCEFLRERTSSEVCTGVCTRRSFVALPAGLTHAFKPNPRSHAGPNGRVPRNSAGGRFKPDR
jgi:hypothetical protein